MNNTKQTAATLDATAFFARLRDLGACADARQWAQGQDYATAWSTCHRGDWLMWLLRKVGMLDQPTTVRLAYLFAREVLSLNTDARVSACLETVERWLNGKATIGQVREARKAAGAAAAYAAYAAYDAAYAAMSAGDAAAYAAYAAYDAATAAADAHAYATATATADAARLKARARQADIIRELVAMPPL